MGFDDIWYGSKSEKTGRGGIPGRMRTDSVRILPVRQ